MNKKYVLDLVSCQIMHRIDELKKYIFEWFSSTW